MCVRAAVNTSLRAAARGPGVWVEGGGGAGDGDRFSAVVVAIIFGVVSELRWMSGDSLDSLQAIQIEAFALPRPPKLCLHADAWSDR